MYLYVGWILSDTRLAGGRLLTRLNWGCPISRVLGEKWADPVSAIWPPASRKTREAGHPRLFRSRFKTNPRYTFRVNVGRPPGDERGIPPFKKRRVGQPAFSS